MADKHEVSQFVVSATRVLHVLREDFDVSPSDELLIEGVLHCLIKAWLEREERRELLH